MNKNFKRFEVSKLIRDKLLSLMEGKGIIAHSKSMDKEEFIFRLKLKLLEEAQEVQEATSLSELTEELADALEVIYVLLKENDINLDHVEKVRKNKLAEKGGFDSKTFINFVDILEDNPAIDYYVSRKAKYPVIQTSSNQPDCFFCKVNREEEEVKVIAKFKYCYAIEDQFPVSKGHTLIISYEHTENWFTVSEETKFDMIRAINDVKEYLSRSYSPTGYNIGANCGSVAGQSVMHFHIHVIPRYTGDVPDPKGGVRGVIPSKQKY